MTDLREAEMIDASVAGDIAREIPAQVMVSTAASQSGLQEKQEVPQQLHRQTQELRKTLEQALLEWKERGVERFNPVQFRFAETMVRRAPGKKNSVALRLLNKAMMVLERIEAEFETGKSDATLSLQLVTQQFPGSAQQAQELFDRADYKAVQQFEQRLQRHRAHDCPHRRELNRLTHQLLQDEIDIDQASRHCSFGDLLQQQELQLVGAEGPVDSGNSASELKSVRLFRESLSRVNANNRVSESMAKGPENPGPLNEHQLAIRSLRAMRELSPQYLNRFVSYVDTLFWLEAAGSKLQATEKKKAKGGRRKKKSK